MHYWQYPSLGIPEENEFSPKVDVEVAFCFNVQFWSSDVPRD